MTHAIKRDFTYIRARTSAASRTRRDAEAGQRQLPRLRAADDGGGALARASPPVSSPAISTRRRRRRRAHVGGGATHAWVRVYLPGAGWVEFDPTNGIVGNRDLIRVAIARDPAQAMPLAGTWTGFPSDSLGMDGRGRGDARGEARPGAAHQRRRVLINPKEIAPCKSAPAIEIAYDCPQPTPMLLVLSVHPVAHAGPDRGRTSSASIRRSRRGSTRDSFGNICHPHHWRPPGRLTMSADFIVERSGHARRLRAGSARSIPVRSCRTRRWSSCSAAATARPTGCPTPPGRCSAARRPAGRGCRRSATTCTTTSPSATSTRDPTRPPADGLQRDDAASAATSRIWPSRSAAA